MNKIIKQDVTIVNELDEIIWYKKRWTIKEEDIYRVSVLLIKNTAWLFLLSQRSFKKKNNPWQWSFSVAWTIDKWENYDSNISKEIEEEIWMKNLKYEKNYKKRIYWEHNFFCQFYTTISDKNLEDFKIQEDEIEAIKWFSEEEVLKWEYEWNKISFILIDEYKELYNNIG